MSSYRVTWKIDVDAETPEEAAKFVWNNYFQHHHTASYFDVLSDSERVLLELCPETSAVVGKDCKETF